MMIGLAVFFIFINTSPSLWVDGCSGYILTWDVQYNNTHGPTGSRSEYNITAMGLRALKPAAVVDDL